MRIIFVRHGSDEPGYRGGWSQHGLIAQGVKEARALLEHLSLHYYPINHILYSDLPRASQTAEILNKGLKCPMTAVAKWREMNNGDLAGMAESEARKRFPGVFANALKMDEQYPNGESPVQFRDRIEAALEETCRKVLLQEYAPHLLVVTHAGPIRVVCHSIERVVWTNKSTDYPVANTGIYVVERQNNTWQLMVRNDMQHLQMCQITL